MKINYPKTRKLKGSLSEEHRRHISNAVPKGDKHSSWKGDKVGYAALHEWVSKKLGNPSICKHCKTTKAKRFEWANVSGKYKREIKDWIRLCTPCHRRFDGQRYEAVIK